MRVMGMIMSTLVLGVGVGGCSNGPGGRVDADDGPRCGQSAAGGQVHIEIQYADNGAPSVLPDKCTVARGTRISWRGPDDRATPFLVKFRDESPAGRGEPKDLRSQASHDRQRIVLVAGGEPREYKYAIEANGITVDPAIIIR